MHFRGPRNTDEVGAGTTARHPDFPTRRRRIMREVLDSSVRHFDSGDRMHSFADAVPDAIIVSDRDGIIQLWNRGAERIFGYREDEAVGRPVATIVPEPMRAAHQAGLERVAEGGQPHVMGERIELTAVRRDGLEVPVELSLGQWIGPEGPMFCGVIRDVSARSEADERLRASESRHRGLVQNASIGIYRSTPHGRFLDVNPALVRMLGYDTPQELLAVPVAELYADESVRAGILADVLRSGEIHALDVVWKRKDGAPIRVHLNGTLIRDVAGAPDTFEVVAEDVTDLWRAQSLARLQAAALDAVANAVVFTEPDGTIVWVNRAFTTLTGYAPEEAVGRTPRILNSGVHPKAFFEEMWKTVSEGGVWRGELVNRRKDGSLYTEEMTIAPVFDDAGRITHYVAVKQDATDRARAREAEREARVAAEEAARMKTAFLANMSHEIRTPMNGVMGMTELLLDSDLDPEQRRAAELVKDSAESLLSIINHILDYSKAEAGRMELEATSFDLSSVVGGAVRMFGVSAFARGVELTYRVDERIPTPLIGDPGRLRQVITNLVGNALKFTSEGEVVVDASLDQLSGDRATISIAVRDTGIGIDPEKLDLVFEDFTQADSSTTREYGGTGLGLSITRRIVDLFGGRISVESTPGKGSTFKVTVPLAVGSASQVPRVVERFDRLAGARALVVDDNATNRTLLCETLTKAGAVVEEAQTADAALLALQEASQAEPFDLAIIDCYMPGMDGFELAAAVQRDPDLGDVRMMMLTSAGQAGDAQRCRDLGIAAYMSKPISALELLDAVAVMLGTEKAERDSDFLITRHSIDQARVHREVLLVEDNLVNQQVAAGMLEKRGHRVTIVGNGALAVEAAVARDYDVILMDVEMPVMDGIEAAERIAETLGERRPTIIALTAHALVAEREDLMSGPFDGFVGKPFKPLELFRVVEAPVVEAT
jgi:two-component system, sensor histidine kinase and response regulator